MTWVPLLLSDPSPNLRFLVLKELLKRPAGKLRETWFQVYIHKNKKYTTKQ